MGSIDAALKPRLRLRTRSEYAGWILSILLGIGILTSVLTNPNFKWGVVAQYFTHESILRGLMLTIFLTLASMALGTLLGLGLAMGSVGLAHFGDAKKGMTMVVVTHEMGFAHEVLGNPQEPRTQSFLEKVL